MGGSFWKVGGLIRYGVLRCGALHHIRAIFERPAFGVRGIQITPFGGRSFWNGVFRPLFCWKWIMCAMGAINSCHFGGSLVRRSFIRFRRFRVTFARCGIFKDFSQSVINGLF